MPRTPLIRSTSLPYHLYGRSNNREWFYLPLNEVWEIFLSHLRTAIDERGLLVHAFVLMSNHYHLLATACGESVDRVMCSLLKGISDEINRRAGRINHLFGGPYKWTLIENWFHYHHTLRYVYQNPIRAGICGSVTEYPFSSLRHFFQRKASPFPLASHLFERAVHDYILELGYAGWIAWLDTPYDPDHVDGMRRALARRQFKFCADRLTRKVPKEFDAERCGLIL